MIEREASPWYTWEYTGSRIWEAALICFTTGAKLPQFLTQYSYCRTPALVDVNQVCVSGAYMLKCMRPYPKISGKYLNELMTPGWVQLEVYRWKIHIDHEREGTRISCRFLIPSHISVRYILHQQQWAERLVIGLNRCLPWKLFLHIFPWHSLLGFLAGNETPRCHLTKEWFLPGHSLKMIRGTKEKG